MTTALAPRQQATQRSQQYQPRNANEQADANATRLLARLQNYNFGLSNDLAATLQSNGIPAETLPMIVSTCVASGVSPALLAYRHNIPAIVRVMSQVVDLGYRAGEDFHVAVFTSKTKVMDEYGEPTKETVDAHTVVVMPSAARTVENMRNEDRLNSGVYHHFEPGQLEGDEVRKVFDQQLGTSAPWGDGVVVAFVDMYTYINGRPIGSGKPTRFYGFFLPLKYGYNNKIEENYLEKGKVKDNYTPYDIAVKRATVKAARSVTRTNYPRDNRPADVRRAALTESALTKLSDIESDARKYGISVEAAFDSAMVEDEPTKTPSMMPAEKSQVVESDGDILFGFEDAPKHRRPRTQPDPIIPDSPIPTGDDDGAIDGEWTDASVAPTDILSSNLPEPVIDWVASIRKKFVGGCKLATEKQVEYARKCVELVTGQGTFDEVYATLAPVGYEDEAMPLAVADIFFTLPQKRRTQNQESGKWETVENDKYNAENVEFTDIIAKWIVTQNEIDL